MKCAHCNRPGTFALNRCDTCTAQHHNHDVELCMACHPDEAELIGVGSGIMSISAELVKLS